MNTLSSLCQSIGQLSIESIESQKSIKGSHVDLIIRKLKIYFKALDYAEQRSIIGVGAITYAENRCNRFDCLVRRFVKCQD